MKGTVLNLCMAAIFAFAAVGTQAQTCPGPLAEMISPPNGSTLPAGADTFTWCDANADYFLTVESVPGAHDIFFAEVTVTSITLGPACANNLGSENS
jgi:hypothetical protein